MYRFKVYIESDSEPRYLHINESSFMDALLTAFRLIPDAVYCEKVEDPVETLTDCLADIASTRL